MIIEMKKFLFIGTRAVAEVFLQRAQAAGCCEFIAASGQRADLSPATQRLRSAVQILQGVALAAAPLSDRRSAATIAEETILLQQKRQRLQKEQRALAAEIARVGPLGDFLLAEVRAIEQRSGRRIRFFCRQGGQQPGEQLSEEVFYVRSEGNLDYFMTIEKQPQALPKMLEMHVEASASELQQRAAAIEQELVAIEKSLRCQARARDFLQQHLQAAIDADALAAAKKNLTPLLEGALFTVQAWVPASCGPRLAQLVEGIAVYFAEIAIASGEQIPTHIENRGLAKIGEDLVEIYDTPAPDDHDPSRWVFYSFILFFALIVADAGYGLLGLGAATVLARRAGRRVRSLALSLAVACTLWGSAMGAFFAISFPPHSIFRRYSIPLQLAAHKASYHLRQQDSVQEEWNHRFPQLQQLRDGRAYLQQAYLGSQEERHWPVLERYSNDIMLELSLLIGIVHLATALLRNLSRCWAGLGWVIFLLGGYLYAPAFLQATSLLHILTGISKESSVSCGWQLIASGMGLAALLAIAQKRWQGAWEVLNGLQIFVDVLSYLRLYALAFAGSIMAATFNDIGRRVGLFFGLLVIFLGHGINFTLSVMGGVIHGLRLNFIEWYHYCFCGGGRRFRPLQRFQLEEEGE